MPASILSSEERIEYEALLHAAAYDNGRLVPSNLVASRAHALLIDAVKAGRHWAEIELERCLLEGLRNEVKRYVKRTNVTTETNLLGSRTRSSVYSVRQRTELGTSWQPKLFEEMTVSDLDSMINNAGAQIQANVSNREAATKLRDHLLATGKSTVGEALTSLGKSLEEALAS